MRTTLLATAAVFGMAMALPALAQTATDQTPANPSAVQDGTPAAGTGSGAAPGNDPATSGKTGATLGPNAPSTGPGPMGEQANPSSNSSSAASGNGTVNSGAGSSNTDTGVTGSTPDQASGNSMDQGTTAARPRHDMSSSNETSGGGRWAHQPGTGESGPASMRASNIDSADTHSTIAPHLPTPVVGMNAGPDGYLRAADRALSMHRTGAAQQALEMAETRLLDRSTPAPDANQPDQNPRIQAVTAARKALASGDLEGARHSIQEAMNAGGGQTGSMGGGATGADAASPAMNPPSSQASSQGGATGSMQNGMNSTAANPNGGPVGGNFGPTPGPNSEPTGQAPSNPGAANAGNAATPRNPSGLPH